MDGAAYPGSRRVRPASGGTDLAPQRHHFSASSGARHVPTVCVGLQRRGRSAESQRRLGYYLSEAGLYASLAGDLSSARRYIDDSIRNFRDSRQSLNESIGHRHRAALHVMLGNLRAAAQAADEALTRADRSRQEEHVIDAKSCVAWVADMAGESMRADGEFIAANQLERHIDGDGAHLYSVAGLRWASFLGRTGRADAAVRITQANLDTSLRHGWPQDAARCRVLLSQLSLGVGESTDLSESISLFADGDCLVDLADALVVAAEQALMRGDLRRAGQHIDDALSFSVRRGLVPAIAAALNTQARLAVEQCRTRTDTETLATARDRTETALKRSGTVPKPMRWHQLTALRTHAQIDTIEGTDNGWSEQARQLQAALLPADLMTDPLGRVRDGGVDH